MKKRKKTPKKFYCKKCDFSSNNKKDFNRHLSTTKHKMETDGNILETKKTPFICLCGKTYKYRSGLFKHKKKCPSIVEKSNVSKNPKTKLIKSTNVDEQSMNVDDQLKIIEEKQRLVKLEIQLAEINQCKIVNQTINNTNNTNNNMTINLFINEHCKNAMNLTDFVENVKISLADLEYTSQHGYAKGISNIFIKQLEDMPVTERPIHCSDKKRMQFYVKEEDEWKKDEKQEKVTDAIGEISKKQFFHIKEWEKQNPDYLTNDKKREKWHKMVCNMGKDRDDPATNKNIKKQISNSVKLNKEDMENEII